MKLRYIIFILIICICKNVSAKKVDSTEIKLLQSLESRAKHLSKTIFYSENDTVKIQLSFDLQNVIDSFSSVKLCMKYPFDSLQSTGIKIVEPRDKKFKLFTFQTKLLNQNVKKFGVLIYKERRNVLSLKLTDTCTKNRKEALQETLEPDEWVGATYYGISAFKVKRKMMYLLVGFDGHNIHSNKSIIDVLFFDREGVHFGAPVFKQSDQDPDALYRVVFEYHKSFMMNVNFEGASNIVVIDKLAPSFPEAVNNFYYYIATGDYDCFTLDAKGFWTRRELNNNIYGKDPDKIDKKNLPTPDKDKGNE